MTGRVLAVANMKGGVGKTTSTVMLAEGLALRPAKCGTRLNRVLLIDTDPQASLGYVMLGYKSLLSHIEAHKHVSSLMTKSILLKQEVDVASAIVGPVNRIYGSLKNQLVDTNISIIATGPEMIHTERMVIRELSNEGLNYPGIRRRVFSFFRDGVLRHARANYDWTLVDCAPGLNMLAQSAIALADGSVVVTVPEPMGLFGLEVFLSGVWGGDDDLPTPRKPMVLASRVNAHQVAHAQQLGILQRPGSAMAPYKLLDTRIPESAHIDGNTFMATSPMSLSARYGSAIGSVVKALAAEVERCVDDQ